MPKQSEEIIQLADGSTLVALDPKEKELLEKEVEAVMLKYSATFLPVLIKKDSIAHSSTTASIALYKKIPAPSKPDAKENDADKTAEAPVAPAATGAEASAEKVA
ncbi:MAG: hypothetical protein WC767_03685 [Candidatus Paceibacterota bacterium]|jgi:hypothetical protein